MAPGMLVQLVPFVLTCHCTVGVGDPLAEAVKLTEAPATTDSEAGLLFTIGFDAAVELTVRTAALLATVPEALLNTARYWLPVIAVVAVTL